MRRITFLGLAVLLLVSACGGDDESKAVGDSGAVSSGLSDDDDGGDAVTSGLADEQGSSDGASSGTASVDACELLTLDQVVGQGIPAASGPTRTPGDFGFDECTFADDDGTSTFQIQVFPPSDGAGAFSDAEQIAGIGEAAVYSEGSRSLSIDLSDGSMISLHLPFSVEVDPRDPLIELGRIAAG